MVKHLSDFEFRIIKIWVKSERRTPSKSNSTISDLKPFLLTNDNIVSY